MLHVVDAVLSPASNLTAVERTIVLALARYRDAGSGACWPSHATLAADAGTSEKSVRRTLQRVRRRDDLPVWIDWLRPSRRDSCRYTIELRARRPRAVTRSTLSPDAESTLAPGPTAPSTVTLSTEYGHPVPPSPDTVTDDPPSDPPKDPPSGDARAPEPFKLVPQDSAPKTPAKKTPAPTSKPPKKTPPRKPETPLPSDWEPTDAHRAQASKAGLDIRREVVRFRTHAESIDRRLRNWDAGFRIWLFGSEEGRGGRPASRVPRPQGAGNLDELDAVDARNRARVEAQKRAREGATP